MVVWNDVSKLPADIAYMLQHWVALLSFVDKDGVGIYLHMYTDGSHTPAHQYKHKCAVPHISCGSTADVQHTTPAVTVLWTNYKALKLHCTATKANEYCCITGEALIKSVDIVNRFSANRF